LMGLALDVGFTRLPLGVERVERLFQSFFRGLPRVDRAPLDGGHVRAFPRRPKKRGPDQRVPVILVAISESDVQVRPFQLKPASSTTTLRVRAAHSRVRTVPGFTPPPEGELTELVPDARASRRRWRRV